MKKRKQKRQLSDHEARIAKMGAKALRAELVLRDHRIAKLTEELGRYQGFFQEFKGMLRIDRSDVSNWDD